jgi:hypothetical protein
LISNKKNLFEKTVTEKPEAIAMCKEVPVIPDNKVVDRNTILGKMRAEEEERHKGLLTPSTYLTSLKLCRVTVKSEVIVCARRCWSSQLPRWWTRK